MDALRSLPRYLRSPSTYSQYTANYLTGLKGIFALLTFFWVYLHTFIPTTVAAVDESSNVPGPRYQVLLRKTLSVLFWNEDLLYSAFILLSARCVPIPFLQNSTGAQMAGSLFRRTIRLVFPVAVSLGLVYLVLSKTGYSHISSFKELTGNTMIEDIYQLPNPLVYFNSIFNVFWISNNFASQAASLAFPTQSLWVVSVVFQESYTIYMTMVIIPYTRPSWRVKALGLFIVTAFWVQSWAWYSITGLLMADAVHNMSFKARTQRGIPVYRGFCCPFWVVAMLIMSVGLMMQYLWTAWRPEYQNRELEAHAGLYSSGATNKNYDLKQPQARDDNYLILVGLLLLVESSDIFQIILSFPFFVYIGDRALSYFLTQSLIAYTAGINIWLYLRVEKDWSMESTHGAALGVCLTITVVAGEIFYRAVDHPSQWAARKGYQWIKS